MHDQCRDPNGAQHVTDIRVIDVAQPPANVDSAAVQALGTRRPTTEPDIVLQTRRQPSQRPSRAEALPHLGHPLAEDLVGNTLRIPVRCTHAGAGVHEHQGFGPLWMRRREQQGRRRREPEDHHPFAAHRIDDRDDIVDPRLHETPFGLVDRIRRARAPRVEPHMPAERRQTVEKTRQGGLVPHEINREQRRPNNNDVNRTRPHHLIRDPSRLRPHVAGLDRVHLASLPSAPPSRMDATPTLRDEDGTDRRVTRPAACSQPPWRDVWLGGPYLGRPHLGGWRHEGSDAGSKLQRSG